MLTKILKTLAFVLTIIFVIAAIWLANGLIGNPISKALAKSAAEKHLRENYSDTDFELDGVTYSFKDGYYHANVSSESSIDSHFALLINSFGQVQDDYYDHYVKTGWNTAARIDADYRKIVEELFESASFPFNAYIAYGEIWFISEEYKDAPDVPDYALITEELTLDAFYNANELGKNHGKLTVYLYDDEVTVERLAKILLEIRTCFDEAGVGFHAIDCVLEPTRNDDRNHEYARVEVMDFLYSDIYAEGIVERVDTANEAAKEYYRLADLEKGLEME